MTARSLVSDGGRAAADSGQQAHRPLLTACAYAVLSVGLDRINLVHVLPEAGFTLWNPEARRVQPRRGAAAPAGGKQQRQPLERDEIR